MSTRTKLGLYTWIVLYWAGSAREANRWRVQLRREAKRAASSREAERLGAESQRWRERRDIFVAEARRLRLAAIEATD